MMVMPIIVINTLLNFVREDRKNTRGCLFILHDTFRFNYFSLFLFISSNNDYVFHLNCRHTFDVYALYVGLEIYIAVVNSKFCLLYALM